jgi:tetratricopeptide (TPR) repeat protein
VHCARDGLARSPGRPDDCPLGGEALGRGGQRRESATAAGYRSVPHPRAEIAEILLDAGRRSEADTIYAELRVETPDDVWLYNSAGWAYSRAGDHQEALRWLDEGIELALRSGDGRQTRLRSPAAGPTRER